MTQTPVETVVTAFTRRLEAQGLAVTRRDTHVSTVLLAGGSAWKFRKAVDFGFLDFSTPAARKKSCAREIALNARYAPGLYEGVETITSDDGLLAEDAVKMRRFDEAELLSARLAKGRLDEARTSALLAFAGALHMDAVAAPSQFGTPRQVRAQVEGALIGIDPTLHDGRLDAHLAACLERCHGALVLRHARSHIRDCHGDLHAANVVWLDGRWRAFDCIEFNDSLRYIDPASDLGFLLMDVEHLGQAALAHQLLDAWVTATGDMEALSVLPLYRVYRALVRAKVACLEAAAAAPEARMASRARARSLLALAERYLRPAVSPTLVITHGVSASGKSSNARRLVLDAGLLHLRADFERRRIAGLPLYARSASRPGTDLYSEAHNRATYDRLAHAAASALGAGQSVVVDATFLRHAQRLRFRALAAVCGATFRILDCQAPEAILRERLYRRSKDDRDPSEATQEVLSMQLAKREPLTTEEQGFLLPAGGDRRLRFE